MGREKDATRQGSGKIYIQISRIAPDGFSGFVFLKGYAEFREFLLYDFGYSLFFFRYTVDVHQFQKGLAGIG
jgi:hypothetical protein